MEDKMCPLRLVCVVRTRSLAISKSELEKSPQLIVQLDTANLFARTVKRSIGQHGVILRTQARFDPATNPEFQTVIELSAANNEMILIDDYIRLIDCRESSRAIEQATYLKKHVPNLFSVLHGKLVAEIPVAILAQQVRDKVVQSQMRSKNIKSGLGKHSDVNDGPSRKAIQAGVKSKKRTADNRALLLSKVVERIRLGLDQDRQSNLSAIADALNAADIKTPSGRGGWQGTTVKRVLERAARCNQPI